MTKLTPDNQGRFSGSEAISTLEKAFSIPANGKTVRLSFEQTGTLTEFHIYRSLHPSHATKEILTSAGSTNDFTTASYTMPECFGDPLTDPAFQITLRPGYEFEIHAAGNSTLKLAGSLE